LITRSNRKSIVRSNRKSVSRSNWITNRTENQLQDWREID